MRLSSDLLRSVQMPERQVARLPSQGGRGNRTEIANLYRSLAAAFSTASGESVSHHEARASIGRSGVKRFEASHHGQSKPFEGQFPTEQECSDGSAPPIEPTCATSLGIAYSGERYEKFLRSFPQGNQYPNAANVKEQINGWVCNGGFVRELAEAGGFLESLVTER